MTDPAVARLEAERLNLPPRERNTADPAWLWRELLDLIAAECRRKGYLPSLKGRP